MALKIVKHHPVRVGVVGCGVVADYGHIPAIDRAANAELVAFADPDPERRAAQAEKYGKPAFASLEEMAAAMELDALSIPTHPGIKLELVRQAASHGLHVFVEKPITASVQQAEELVRLMDEADLLVGVAFIYRGKHEVQRMQQLVREGAIGKLRAVHIENMWDYHGLRSAEWGEHYQHRRHRALENMGTLDCGVHDLDLVRYFTGSDYCQVHAVGTIIEAANQYPDHLMMHARMDNGIVASVEESAVWGYTASDTPRYQQSYRLVGENGVLAASHSFAGKEQKPELYVVSGGKQWTETVDSAKAWDETYRQFFAIILGEDVPHKFIANGHDALANMKVASSVIQQAMQ